MPWPLSDQLSLTRPKRGGPIPKLDVAGSSPVARSGASPNPPTRKAASTWRPSLWYAFSRMTRGAHGYGLLHSSVMGGLVSRHPHFRRIGLAEIGQILVVEPAQGGVLGVQCLAERRGGQGMGENCSHELGVQPG